MMKWYYIFVLGFLLFSCGKEKITLAWVEVDSQTVSPLTAVVFTDENNGYAVGGDSWFRAVASTTRDGGLSWTADSIGPKQIFGLHFNQDKTGYAVGHDGLLYVKDELEDTWQVQRLIRWDSHRAVAFYGDQGIIVSGSAYQNGVIQQVGPSYQTAVADTFENELSAVCYSDAQTVHVVGYGLVLRSLDGGTSWSVSPVQGDFFRDIYFPSSQVGYIAGYSGSILKTTDGGENWDWLRKGNAQLVSDKPFRAVHFADELKGYVVGDRGTFWRTLNGGEDWQIDKGFPEVDFWDVFAIGDGGFVVGEEGKIIKFTD